MVRIDDLFRMDWEPEDFEEFYTQCEAMGIRHRDAVRDRYIGADIKEAIRMYELSGSDLYSLNEDLSRDYPNIDNMSDTLLYCMKYNDMDTITPVHRLFAWSILVLIADEWDLVHMVEYLHDFDSIDTDRHMITWYILSYLEALSIVRPEQFKRMRFIFEKLEPLFIFEHLVIDLTGMIIDDDNGGSGIPIDNALTSINTFLILSSRLDEIYSSNVVNKLDTIIQSSFDASTYDYLAETVQMYNDNDITIEQTSDAVNNVLDRLRELMTFKRFEYSYNGVIKSKEVV